MSALEKDPATGDWRLKMGNYIVRNDIQDPEVGYVTWDGQLTASFTQLEKLINMLAVMSEMGTVLFDNAENTGNAASGTALKLRYMPMLAKVKRLCVRYTPALVKAIKLCSQLGGNDIVDLTDADVSITWQDGLPNDERERAEIAEIRTGAKPTMSQKDAIMYLDEVGVDQAQLKYDNILEEEAMSMPTQLGGFPTPPNMDMNMNANQNADPNAFPPGKTLV
jgi:hypothetical protein